MSKQWICEDCVKQNTDACYFTEVLDGYKYCHDIVVDVDYAYEQSRADAIEELSDLIDRLLWDYDLETYKDLSESFKESARLLKEKKK